MVNERHRYFHPVGQGGWPKVPPNYLAFRYDGRLQTIHHVEAVIPITDIQTYMPELNPGPWTTPHFLYTLGPAIRPTKRVVTGKFFRNGRVWAMLDLLLTSESIAQARDLTKSRCNSPSDGDFSI
jgi:hypothetical protein